MVITQAKVIVVPISQGGDDVVLAGKKLEEEINAWLDEVKKTPRILHVTQTSVNARSIHPSLVCTIVYELQCSR